MKLKTQFTSRTHINVHILAIIFFLVQYQVISDGQQPSSTERPKPSRPWLRQLRTSSRAQTQPQQAQLKPIVQPPLALGSVIEVPPPSSPVASRIQPQVQTNRSTRTADIFQNGDGFNIFVTNTCERESMKINVKTSRAFYGVIHTRDHRNKSMCRIEGNGETDYNLEINQVLDHSDSSYCGAIRGPRNSPDDKEVVSVIVAVRVHKTIELSDDRFFLLNCTNRCRKSDCSSPNSRLTFDSDDSTSNRGPSSNSRLTEDESEREGVDTTRVVNNGSPSANGNGNSTSQDECNIYKFPWAVALLWCLAILCLALLISHCILCSSMVCKCVRTEVEEREPSIFEGGTDYSRDNFDKRHPYRIEYDNADIYKTANNYDPYCLESDVEQTEPKKRKHKRGQR